MSKHNRSTNFKTLQTYWRFTREYPFSFWYGTIGAALGVLAQEVLPPLVIAAVFDRIQNLANSGQPLILADFMPLLYVYVGLLLFGFIMFRTQVWFVWSYQVKADRKMSAYIFNHLQKMGASFHSNRFGGALVSQTTKFLGSYQKIADEFTWAIVTGLTSLTSVLIILGVKAPFYAAVLVVGIILYFTIMYKRVKRQFPYDRAVASMETKRTAALADMVTNVAAVQSFAGEEQENKIFAKSADRVIKAHFELRSKALKNDAVSHSMTASINVIAFVSGVLAITVLGAPAGILYLAVSYTMSIARRLWESFRVLRNLNRAFGDATEMTEILQLEPEIKDPVNPKPLDVDQGQITFNDVHFAYESEQDHNTKVFHDLTLDIPGGQKVGLVGHSGGGKTTVTKLLLRFMDIQKGTIAIDGADITEVAQADLRRHIAYVPQEPMLFHRTIAENISYGKPDASRKEIEAVAKKAHAHEFIKDLPKGYDTLVGERGVKLSGGQRQRVAIARAMLKDAPILVLDEATSALDSESEKYIQDALWELMKGRTAIVIAHRLSTVQKLDRIVVMENGAITQDGEHAELVKQKGIYADLWSHQSGGFLEE